MPRLRIIGVLLVLMSAMPMSARAEWLPEKSNRLVNDYSGILPLAQCEALEQRLVAFNDSTSNQVVVVITPTLEGDDENAAAQRIGQKWGVGQERFDNGVVILIKSKTWEENWGAVAIATGYGVEGALPDVFCKRIIDDKRLGPLGDGDYYRAINDALDLMLPVLAGEYSYAQYRKDERREAFIALAVLLGVMVLVVVLLCVIAKNHPGGWGNSGSNGGGTYFGGPVGGTWGSGTWGGGSWGSSGGCGGFGGGSFGGGGASGRF